MTNKDIRSKSIVELEQLQFEMRQKLFALRFQNFNGQLETPSHIKETQKLIAKILTIIKEKHLEEATNEIKKSSEFIKSEDSQKTPKKVLTKTKEVKVEEEIAVSNKEEQHG